jgi:uncharacterized membrane protein SpoIIM required for sporulation
MNEKSLTTIALAVLVAGLATLGVLASNGPVLALAATAMGGLFAWLQVAPKG